MPPNAQNTAFVFVPGGFSPGKFFHEVTQRLAELGYAAEAVDHPTVVSDPEQTYAASFDDDVSNLRSAIVKHVEAGKNVVVAANSYGGCVATEAAKGLSRGERKQAGVGSNFALTNLVYIASLLAPTGVTVHDMAGDNVRLPEDPDVKFLEPPPAEAIGALLYSDLEASEQKRFGEQLKPQSIKALAGRITHAGYLYVPTTIVLTENDQTIPPQTQRENIDSVTGRGADNIQVVAINTDHSPMVSHPEKIVEILIGLTVETT